MELHCVQGNVAKVISGTFINSDVKLESDLPCAAPVVFLNLFILLNQKFHSFAFLLNGESVIHWFGTGDGEDFQVIRLSGEIEFREYGDAVAASGEK